MDENLNKEDLILQTAMQVFIDKGWYGTKMQEIADRAGINKALLHYYYRSKEKLYAKIFEQQIWQAVYNIFKLFDEQLSFAEFLKKFIDNYMQLLTRNPKIPMFILRELSEGGKIVQSILQKLIESGKFSVTKPLTIIKNAMDRGEIVEMDPRQVLITVVGSCVFFFVAEPIIKALFINLDTFDRNKFLKERKKAIYDTVYFGLKPRERMDEN